MRYPWFETTLEESLLKFSSGTYLSKSVCTYMCMFARILMKIEFWSNNWQINTIAFFNVRMERCTFVLVCQLLLQKSISIKSLIYCIYNICNYTYNDIYCPLTGVKHYRIYDVLFYKCTYHDYYHFISGFLFIYLFITSVIAIINGCPKLYTVYMTYAKSAL